MLFRSSWVLYQGSLTYQSRDLNTFIYWPGGYWGGGLLDPSDHLNAGPVTLENGSLCIRASAFLSGTFPSLVDYRSGISGNPVWSVYRYATF